MQGYDGGIWLDSGPATILKKTDDERPTMKIKLVPTPMTNPTVTKNPPILLTVHPLKTSPSPRMLTPTRRTALLPNRLIMFELMMAKKDIIADVRPPANDSVDDDARPSSFRRVKTTPKL